MRFQLIEDTKVLCCICVDGKNCVTHMVLLASIWIRGNIVKELVACIDDCFGAVGLTRGNGTECGKEDGVDSSGVVEERANDILYMLDLGGDSGTKVLVSTL
jgi:hypothetical protein